MASQKRKFTHFLSISLGTDEIKRNFELFRNSIRDNAETRHLTEAMIQVPEKLHITVTMLSLNDDDKSEAVALECLQRCKASIIDPVLQGEPLVLQVSGVGIFSDCRPTAVNVVFAKISSPPMQEIANRMAKFFENEGLVKQERETIALHLTLVNTFLERERGFAIRKKPFDATSILERFKDLHFGTVTVKDIHLCRLGTRTPDGYYETAGALEI